MKMACAVGFITCLSISFVFTSAFEKIEDIPRHVKVGNEHNVNGVHNAEFDHKAFLGDDSETFDQLSPEESQRRLRFIVHKIDVDGDGFITHVELKDWIRYTQQKYMRDNVERSWRMHNPDDKKKLSWEEYSNVVYSFMNGMDTEELEKENEGFTYKGIFDRDRRRWSAADSNEDNYLTKEEFLAFLHPEETPHMRDLVVLEALEDIDKDKDKKISLEEYIGDMYQGDSENDKPQWVLDEMEYFSKQRDKDGDGFLDENEVKDWIVPQGFDHADAEARHLIFEADKNHDQKLSEEEVIEKYDMFVGSQATDFGEVLLRHDEF